MKITPLDIQHKVFGLQLRGYHREQVDQFLEALAETVEELIKENGALKEHVAQKDEEIQALKKNETSLMSTLISTQSFVDHLKRGAERDAEMIIKEAELKAEEILAHSRSELIELRRAVNDLRRHHALMLERLRGTLQSFARLIEVEEGAEDPTPLLETPDFTERTNVPES